MTKNTPRSSRDIALPGRLLTTCSLPDAAHCLLERFARIAPGFVHGRLALSFPGIARLAVIASAQRKSRVTSAPACGTEAAFVAEPETLLLTRAYLRGRSFTALHDGPMKTARSSDSRRSEARTEMDFVFPLRNQQERVGAVLLRFAGGGPTASERAEIRRIASAAVNLLINLQRQELFVTLERSKQHWEAAFDALDAMLYIHSTTGELLKVNRALADRLGVEAAELLHRPERFHSHFPQCSAVRQTEMRYWRSDTLLATFETTVAPVYDRVGLLIGCVHILRDVSERLRMEEMVRRNERLAALGEMLSGTAHELNNPLTSILWYADRLCRSDSHEPLPAERIAEMTRKIGLETERAAHIVQDLLSFARPEQHEKSVLCLNDLVEQTVELSSASRDRDRIDLRVCLSEGLPPIVGNFFDLQRALMNLIENARYAVLSHKSHGCITITTAAVEGGALLSVSDNGPGISQEHRERLLDPFFTTKPVGEGTGLGLSICYGILQAHQADLNIRSEQGAGACFEITFRPCGAAPPGSQITSADPPPGDAVTGRNGAAFAHDPSLYRIGILDDEPLIRETLTEILAESRYHVCCFAAPEHALDALKTERFDLLISDIKMPTMSGMEFHGHVERLYPELASRILFITGDAVSSAAQAFFAQPGCRFLQKPFRPAEMLACLEELLARGDGS